MAENLNAQHEASPGFEEAMRLAQEMEVSPFLKGSLRGLLVKAKEATIGVPAGQARLAELIRGLNSSEREEVAEIVVKKAFDALETALAKKLKTSKIDVRIMLLMGATAATELREQLVTKFGFTRAEIELALTTVKSELDFDGNESEDEDDTESE